LLVLDKLPVLYGRLLVGLELSAEEKGLNRGDQANRESNCKWDPRLTDCYGISSYCGSNGERDAQANGFEGLDVFLAVNGVFAPLLNRY
jgi:hypothetical protein